MLNFSLKPGFPIKPHNCIKTYPRNGWGSPLVMAKVLPMAVKNLRHVVCSARCLWNLEGTGAAPGSMRCLMEEIRLKQLTCFISHMTCRVLFIHPRWLFGISSINSMFDCIHLHFPMSDWVLSINKKPPVASTQSPGPSNTKDQASFLGASAGKASCQG